MIKLSFIRRYLRLAFDIVYNPLRTRLPVDAEEQGLKTASGIETFVNQAALHFEAWTGKTAPIEVMRAAVLDQLK